jgi:hypothetical protein
MDNFKQGLANSDNAKLVSIMVSRPTICDVEEASMWARGRQRYFRDRPSSQARGWRYRRELLAGEKEEHLRSLGSFKL